MTPRTQPRWARDRPVTRHCEVPGCGVATRASKPFCSDHVEQHPYIQSLLHKIMDSQLEVQRVRQLGARAVDVFGLNAQEILQFVRVNGERTVPRLARDLNMHLSAVEGYVKALRRRRLIVLSKNARGTPLIRLPGQRRLRAKVASPSQAADSATQASDTDAA